VIQDCLIRFILLFQINPKYNLLTFSYAALHWNKLLALAPFTKAAATGGHSQYAVEQIELDRAGKGVMQALPGPGYAPCP
jgi:hypothetical protein